MITNVKNLTIKKSILHIINGTNSYYNSALLPKSDDKFNEFLIKHIKSSARTRYRQAAKYLTPDNNNTLTSFNLMLENDKAFIENSKKLAENLLAICRTGGYGPYDLIFCEYENEDEEKFIAVLLLEFTTSFFHEITTNNAALIKHLTVLAASNSGLKKCALVQKYDSNDEYSLLINDKNTAEFFIKTFLHCESYMDDRKATETFIKETITWVNDKCNNVAIPPKIKEKLEEVTSECISLINRCDTIDIDAFENNIFRDDIEIYKEDYNTYLERSGLLCKEIDLNEDVTTEYKYHKIKLDNFTEIKLPIDLVYSEEYTEQYKRKRQDNGSTEFKITGKIIKESVKSR